MMENVALPPPSRFRNPGRLFVIPGETSESVEGIVKVALENVGYPVCAFFPFPFFASPLLIHFLCFLREKGLSFGTVSIPFCSQFFIPGLGSVSSQLSMLLSTKHSRPPFFHLEWDQEVDNSLFPCFPCPLCLVRALFISYHFFFPARNFFYRQFFSLRFQLL